MRYLCPSIVCESQYCLLKHNHLPYNLIPAFSDSGMCENHSLVTSLSPLLHASHFSFLSYISHNIYLAQPLFNISAALTKWHPTEYATFLLLTCLNPCSITPHIPLCQKTNFFTLSYFLLISNLCSLLLSVP